MNLLTEQQVAQILGCKVAGLRRWRREGRGPTFIRVERLIRYRATDVDEYVEQSAVQPDPSGGDCDETA